jgi:hypothetical protein
MFSYFYDSLLDIILWWWTRTRLIRVASLNKTCVDGASSSGDCNACFRAASTSRFFLLDDVLSYSPRFVAYASTRQAKTSLNKAVFTGKTLYSGFSTAFVRSMSQILQPGYDSMRSGVWSLQNARRKGSWLLDSERGCNLEWCAPKWTRPLQQIIRRFGCLVRVALYSLEWLLLSRVSICGRTKLLEQQAKQRQNNPWNN